MSEKLHSKAERHETLAPVAPERAEKPAGAERHKKAEKDPAHTLREARARVEETTRTESHASALEQLQGSETAAQAARPLHINRELKSITLNRELTAIRRRLSAPQRTLSKVIHQPAVSAISEPVGKTVTRPSGLLGGGLMAFVGSSGYLYLTRHNGMRYSYFVFVVLLAGGFAFGLLLELLVHVATSGRRHASD